jgi:hypothetical protein
MDTRIDTRREVSLDEAKPPGVLAESGSNETVKLIRKLRWIGMEDEAERLQTELRRQHAAGSDSVVAMSCDTD